MPRGGFPKREGKKSKKKKEEKKAALPPPAVFTSPEVEVTGKRRKPREEEP